MCGSIPWVDAVAFSITEKGRELIREPQRVGISGIPMVLGPFAGIAKNRTLGLVRCQSRVLKRNERPLLLTFEPGTLNRGRVQPNTFSEAPLTPCATTLSARD